MQHRGGWRAVWQSSWWGKAGCSVWKSRANQYLETVRSLSCTKRKYKKCLTCQVNVKVTAECWQDAALLFIYTPESGFVTCDWHWYWLLFSLYWFIIIGARESLARCFWFHLWPDFWTCSLSKPDADCWQTAAMHTPTLMVWTTTVIAAKGSSSKYWLRAAEYKCTPHFSDFCLLKILKATIFIPLHNCVLLLCFGLSHTVNSQQNTFKFVVISCKYVQGVWILF